MLNTYLKDCIDLNQSTSVSKGLYNERFWSFCHSPLEFYNPLKKITVSSW